MKFLDFFFYVAYQTLPYLVFTSAVIQYFTDGNSGKGRCPFVDFHLVPPYFRQSQAALNSVQFLLYCSSASALTFCTISPFFTESGTTRSGFTSSSAALFVL